MDFFFSMKTCLNYLKFSRYMAQCLFIFPLPQLFFIFVFDVNFFGTVIIFFVGISSPRQILIGIFSIPEKIVSVVVVVIILIAIVEEIRIGHGRYDNVPGETATPSSAILIVTLDASSRRWVYNGHCDGRCDCGWK